MTLLDLVDRLDLSSSPEAKEATAMSVALCEYCSHPATFVVVETGTVACYRCAMFDIMDGERLTFV